jgi:response regulator RpfG family c-di-GMP phosphodiesterase
MVVTVYEDRDFRNKALEAGATDFLLSPVDHLEFRARAATCSPSSGRGACWPTARPGWSRR